MPLENWCAIADDPPLIKHDKAACIARDHPNWNLHTSPFARQKRGSRFSQLPQFDLLTVGYLPLGFRPVSRPTRPKLPIARLLPGRLHNRPPLSSGQWAYMGYLPMGIALYHAVSTAKREVHLSMPSLRGLGFLTPFSPRERGHAHLLGRSSFGGACAHPMMRQHTQYARQGPSISRPPVQWCPRLLVGFSQDISKEHKSSQSCRGSAQAAHHRTGDGPISP